MPTQTRPEALLIFKSKFMPWLICQIQPLASDWIIILIDCESFIFLQMGLKIQLFHHMVCSLLVGLIFWNRANDAEMFFDHMKFCMGVILFFAYTHVMVPVLTCK